MPKDENDDIRPAQYAPLYGEEDSPEVDELTEEIENEIKRRKKNGFRELAETILYCILVVGITLFITRFIVQPIEVEGESMEQTLQNRDIVLCLKANCTVKSLDRFDIIIFQPNLGQKVSYVKRIIGLPGEVIYIDEFGRIHVASAYEDGQYIGDTVLEGDPMEEKVTLPTDSEYATVSHPVILGEDEFFVLGDNRINSSDSRIESIGPVKIDQIEGRVIFRLLPFSSLGTIE